MSQLSDYESGATIEVMLRAAKGDKPAQYLSVRGLSTNDVMNLVRIHGTPLADLYEKIVTGKIELNLENSQVLMAVLMDAGPNIVADIITIASGSEDYAADFEIARKLPLTVQTNAIKAVAELTFVDTTPGEFLEEVVKMIAATGSLLSQTTPAAPKPREKYKPSRGG